MQYVRFLIVALFALSTFGLNAHSVSAQSESSVAIIPAFIEEPADPGSDHSYTLTVTNRSSEDKEYFLYLRDIKGVEGGGVPVFADANEEKTGFELTQWLTLPSDTISVPAGASVQVPIAMHVPKDASPGSHFGGVFISVEPPKLRENGASVGYEVASVLSIRISGDVSDVARIRSFSTSKLIYGNKNVHFSARVENQGNILIRPTGPVTITGMFGAKPEVFTVNDTHAGVFPGVSRDFEFDHTMSGFPFGRYEATIALVYDGENGQKTMDSSVIFWVFPSKILLAVMGAFFVIIVGGYLLTRMYIRREIMRAGGSRRIVSHRGRQKTGVSRALFVIIVVGAVATLFLLSILIFLA